MINKVLTIIRNILIGIFAFYLFIAWVAIPLFGPWIVSSQATTILKHKVNVRSIGFNPFLWSLSVDGLNVLDTNKQVMLGFEKFTVDLSFIKLLSKEYRFELIELKGLEVNTALLKDGTFNLLQLIPQESASKPQPSPTRTTPTASKTAPTFEALPLIIVDKLVLHKGVIRFTDQSVTPNFTTVLGDMEFNAVNLSTDPTRNAKTTFQARLNDKGMIKNEAQLRPLAQPLDLETSFTLNGYALQILTPYVGKYTGHAVKDGNLNFKMDYRISNNKLTASHKILVQQFGFGEKVESKDALHLPFSLVVALLEDPQGRIDISLPVTGDMSDPEFHYWHLVGQVARNFFIKVATKPFSFLASVVVIGGGSVSEEDMGNIRFMPGSSVISDVEKTKLDGIIKGLKDRPKVSLEVNGSYDSDIDWKAIKSQLFEENYKTLRTESKRKELDVYKQLYERKFGIDKLWILARKFRLSDGSYDVPKFNAEIKRQLIDEGSADKVALQALGQMRANLVFDYLNKNGFDAKRLTVGAVHTTQGTMGSVPLELVLNVFEK